MLSWIGDPSLKMSAPNVARELQSTPIAITGEPGDGLNPTSLGTPLAVVRLDQSF